MWTWHSSGFQTPRLIGAFLAAAAFAVPIHAQDHPDFYVIGSEQPGSWWKVEARALIDWKNDEPKMTGLVCVASHYRYLQEGKSPMEITVSHPVESGDYRFRISFNLADTDLINRSVETITVGGRPYSRENIQSRIVPWVGGPTGIILSYGISREMYRPNETYPWLPIEFLIPQFFEVEGITLGISGDFEIKHGEYERRYEELYIDMDGLKETMDWCYQKVNPDREHEAELASDLRRMLKQ